MMALSFVLFLAFFLAFLVLIIGHVGYLMI